MCMGYPFLLLVCVLREPFTCHLKPKALLQRTSGFCSCVLCFFLCVGCVSSLRLPVRGGTEVRRQNVLPQGVRSTRKDVQSASTSTPPWLGSRKRENRGCKRKASSTNSCRRTTGVSLSAQPSGAQRETESTGCTRKARIASSCRHTGGASLSAQEPYHWLQETQPAPAVDSTPPESLPESLH